MQEDKTGMFSDEEETEIAQVNETFIDSDWKSDAVTAGGDTENAGKTEEAETEQRPAANEQKADQSFKLKYMGQELDVSRDEIITLAQKGKDYDRIRSRANALSEELRKTGGYKSFLDALAQKTGQSLEDFIGKTKSALSIESKAAGQGAESDGDAERIRTETPSSGADSANEAIRARRSREVAEFLSEYGTIDPRTIPREVWDGVRAGKTLLGAYQSHENKSLKARLLAEQKNLLNAQKAAGSRQSAGGVRARGEIEDDWYNDD